ncbi:MAG TPA: prepilin peptidase [Bacillales bacterium]|nr:prepilin peptidase [Bacillales bacterium]
MWVNVILLIVLFICAATDLKTRKIYNIVIFPGLLLACILRFLQDGWMDLGLAFLGFFVGAGILLIPYLLGGMGAGDVKLLALVGALKGTMFVFYTSFYMAVIGAILALGILIFRRGAFLRIKSITMFFYAWFNGLKIPLFVDKQSLTLTYPYGIAITAGAIICLVLNGG